ncbi:MAG: hypothetical protein ACLGIK_16580, partial [Gemmatimonadota bacterium]
MDPAVRVSHRSDGLHGHVLPLVWDEPGHGEDERVVADPQARAQGAPIARRRELGRIRPEVDRRH